MGGNLIYGSVICQTKKFGSNNPQWLLFQGGNNEYRRNDFCGMDWNVFCVFCVGFVSCNKVPQWLTSKGNTNAKVKRREAD